MTRGGMRLVDPQVISTRELTGSGEGVPEHGPRTFFYIPLIVRRIFDRSAQSRKTSACYRKPTKSANALMYSLQVKVGWCRISEAFIFICARLLAVSADADGNVAHTKSAVF